MNADRREQNLCLISLLQLPSRALVKGRRGGRKITNRKIRGALSWLLNNTDSLREKTPLTAVQRAVNQRADVQNDSERTDAEHRRPGGGHAELNADEIQRLIEESNTNTAIRRCQAYTRDGHIRRAASALASDATFADTTLSSTITALQQLHPELPSTSIIPPLPDSALTAPLIIEASDEMLLRILKQSDNGAAPGPSGWGGNMVSCLRRDPVCSQGITRLIDPVVDLVRPTSVRLSHSCAVCDDNDVMMAVMVTHLRSIS